MLTLVGKRLEDRGRKEFLDVLFQKLALCVTDHKTDSETKQAIVSLSNLRKNKWVPLKTSSMEQMGKKLEEMKVEKKEKKGFKKEEGAIMKLNVKSVLIILQNEHLKREIRASVNLILTCKHFYHNKLLNNHLWRLRSLKVFGKEDPWQADIVSKNNAAEMGIESHWVFTRLSYQLQLDLEKYERAIRNLEGNPNIEGEVEKEIEQSGIVLTKTLQDVSLRKLVNSTLKKCGDRETLFSACHLLFLIIHNIDCNPGMAKFRSLLTSSKSFSKLFELEGSLRLLEKAGFVKKDHITYFLPPQVDLSNLRKLRTAIVQYLHRRIGKEAPKENVDWREHFWNNDYLSYFWKQGKEKHTFLICGPKNSGKNSLVEVMSLASNTVDRSESQPPNFLSPVSLQIYSLKPENSDTVCLAVCKLPNVQKTGENSSEIPQISLHARKIDGILFVIDCSAFSRPEELLELHTSFHTLLSRLSKRSKLLLVLSKVDLFNKSAARFPTATEAVRSVLRIDQIEKIHGFSPKISAVECILKPESLANIELLVSAIHDLQK